MLYSAYEIRNNGAIIKYSEKLFAFPNYEDFIDYINEQNLNSTSIPTAQIVLTNENNYLKNKYVQALCNYDCFDKAVSFAISELQAQTTWQATERTTWLLGTLLSYQSTQSAPNYDFLNLQAGSQTFLALSQTYLDDILSAYTNLKADSTSIENGEFLKNALAYDLNQYLSHIIFLENKITLPTHDFDYYKTAKQNL